MISVQGGPARPGLWGLTGAFSGTQGNLRHPALVDVPSVQQVSALQVSALATSIPTAKVE
jgi:hypothetical protein